MRTRFEQIRFIQSLGLDASHFEAMTDEEFDSERDFLDEQALRHKYEYPHREPLLKIVRRPSYQGESK